MGEGTKSEKVIVFQLGEEEYGVSIDYVGSIERTQPITRVPHTPSFVKGVMNLRSEITPVIDLRERFQLEQIAYTDQTRIIVVQVGEKQLGMIVDGANDVVDVPVSSIEPAPEIVDTNENYYIRGVAKVGERLLLLLHLDEVLSTDELQQLS
ncbi:chemotaxis protein CheW [Salirhabdus salicampi]|uniref:chemotaxis protein CheW n=1 Tax=Salirhabdus salicampi TaxID=476102 RepID=UPI0020C4068B|nr:chemotaxis protein CheW [Salirhabdus salicampi]MCP8616500.1 chemotaxis protein CheW [Salirhabdus salicampi]